MLNNNNDDVVVQNQADTPEGDHTMLQELQECQVQVEAWKEKYLRSMADFNNFKRRTEKEQASWMQSAQEDVLQSLLTVVDDFDRALVEIRTHAITPELQTRLAGFEMINNSLYKVLKQFGVEPMAGFTSFDPVMHEAIASVEDPTKQSGAVVEVLQKGFMIKDRVLRPARVAVAK